MDFHYIWRRYHEMLQNEPRCLSIWTNNSLVVLWYAFVFADVFSKGLSFRYATIWFGSSFVNIVGEHMSIFRSIYTLEFAREALLCALPFVLGIVINEFDGMIMPLRV